MTYPDIHLLLEQRRIDLPDWQFATAVQRIGQCDDPWVGVAAALVNRWAADGHVCLDLDALQEKSLEDPPRGAEPALPVAPGDWQARLRACSAVGRPGDYCPLILDDHRLYLHRYWTYEQSLARDILQRSAQAAPSLDTARLAQVLDRLFPGGEGGQRTAAQQAATQLFTVISGGPGTGKTYTIARIILLLQQLYAEPPLQIHLAAPTGKAAARLQEAVENLLKAAHPEQGHPLDSLYEAQTLHRLLGYMPSASRFRYDAEHPLPTDAVIVDEASMIDLALMHQLVQAVPFSARLILVGDKDQLASVEAGAVLGDICHGIAASPEGRQGADRGLAHRIVILDRSYRFDARSGISALGRAINAGDAEMVLKLLADERLSDIELRPPGERDAMTAALDHEIAVPLTPLFTCQDPTEAFGHLNRFKILTAVRNGPFGVEGMNRNIEKWLLRRGFMPSGASPDNGWYHGRPVMITRNDYHHGLFNGDVGIAMERTAQDGTDIQVVFPGSGGDFKYLAPYQLTEHLTVYAMTIHKSQGSEFDRVMVVLPDEDMPLLTRELIYTAVTRARQSIVIWADPHLLARAVQRPIRRASGLRKALWS